KNTFYGKRFDVIRYEFPDKPSLRSQSLSVSESLAQVDFREPQEDTLLERSFSLTVTEAGLLNGLRLSAVTVFADGSEFDFSVSYSFPVILPVEAIEVELGDVFAIDVSYSMCEGPKRLEYSVQKVASGA
ncbi:MAG: hypothetical protein ACR2QO_26775, partial [Acidimicrobiales bacterium]